MVKKLITLAEFSWCQVLKVLDNQYEVFNTDANPVMNYICEASMHIIKLCHASSE
jgi:hypothetical protein